MQPSSFHSKTEVLSMNVDVDNAGVASGFRIRIGDQVKYISVDPGTFHKDILIFPPELIDHLLKLPSGDWTRARIYRKSDHLVVEPSNTPLKGVTRHHNLVDIQSLVFEEQVSTWACRQVQR